jgi:large repetitive protein
MRGWQCANKVSALIALARGGSPGRAGRLRSMSGRPARALIAAIAASLLVPVAVVVTMPTTAALASTPAPLLVTTTAPLTATAGSSFLGKLDDAGGTKPYSWSLASGTSLPAGLVLHASNGEITGTPAGPAGTSDFIAEVTDSEGSPVSATAPESITVVVTPLAVTTVALPAATAGVAYSATLAAVGGVAPYSWSIPVGSLPAGLKLHAATGVISGTPTDGGNFAFAAEVTDSEGQAQSGSASESITVGVSGLVVTTGSILPTATSGGLSSAGVLALLARRAR